MRTYAVYASEFDICLLPEYEDYPEAAYANAARAKITGMSGYCS